MKKLLLVITLLWAGGAAGYYYWTEARPGAVRFRTLAVRKGDLQATINAMGTLEPEEVVDVGAQIAAEVVSFGTDPDDPSRPVSHLTVVKKGTVLARLNDKLLQARVGQADASVAKAAADVETAKVKKTLANKNLDRDQRLMDKQKLPQAEYDAAVAEAATAKVAIQVADGALALARANKEEAEVNLGYTTITSPVDGIVIDRRVNVGQTVVASLNAPSLFLIAKDLRRMEIWSLVNETDIGQIHPGQTVRFDVADVTKETLKGVVKQTRLNAVMNQSVVTYTVVVEVDNADGKLIPYMSARLRFEVEGRTGVLLVPNSALRWTPAVGNLAPEDRADFTRMQRARAIDREQPKAGKGHRGRGTLWVRSGEFVRARPVTVGLSDGLQSEVSDPSLRENEEVVVGVAAADADGTDAGASPFLPSIKNDKPKK